MGSDQYHEPASELTQEVRTFARIITSLQEEAEAIGWYEQRISLEKDAQAKRIMENAQQEEFKHFGDGARVPLTAQAQIQAVLRRVLFHKGDIVKLGEAGEEAEKDA